MQILLPMFTRPQHLPILGVHFKRKLPAAPWLQFRIRQVSPKRDRDTGFGFQEKLVEEIQPVAVGRKVFPKIYLIAT